MFREPRPHPRHTCGPPSGVGLGTNHPGPPHPPSLDPTGVDHSGARAELPVAVGRVRLEPPLLYRKRSLPTDHHICAGHPAISITMGGHRLDRDRLNLGIDRLVGLDTKVYSDIGLRTGRVPPGERAVGSTVSVFGSRRSRTGSKPRNETCGASRPNHFRESMSAPPVGPPSNPRGAVTLRRLRCCRCR